MGRKVRIALGCCVLAFFAFFVLGQLGLIQSPAVRKAIASHREQALAKARMIEGLHVAAASAAADPGPWNEESVLALTGIPVTADNTAAIHLENLKDAARNLLFPRAIPVCFCRPHPLTSAVSLARTGRWPGGDRVSFDAPVRTIEGMFASLERLRYLIVVRPSLYVPPELGRPGDFSSGSYHAEAFLFELATGRMLGSFGFGAGNSRIVKTTGKGLTLEALEDDLAFHAGESFQAGLGERLPTAARGKEAW